MQSVEALRREADEVVCPHEQRNFGAVGFWYGVFTQVGNGEVVALLDELRRAIHELTAASQLLRGFYARRFGAAADSLRHARD